MIPQIASRWYQYEKRWVLFYDLLDFDTTRFDRDTVTEKTLYKSRQTWYIVAGGRYSNRKLYHHMIRKKKSRTENGLHPKEQDQQKQPEKYSEIL